MGGRHRFSGSSVHRPPALPVGQSVVQRQRAGRWIRSSQPAGSSIPVLMPTEPFAMTADAAPTQPNEATAAKPSAVPNAKPAKKAVASLGGSERALEAIQALKRLEG